MRGKHVLLILAMLWLAFCLYFGLKMAEAYEKLVEERTEIYKIK